MEDSKTAERMQSIDHLCRLLVFKWMEMVPNKYLHRLKQNALKTGAELKFEEISKDPEENRVESVEW